MTGVLLRRGKRSTEMRMPHEKKKTHGETQREDDQGMMEAEMEVMHLEA